jgi:Tol biopolymer transport system component
MSRVLRRWVPIGLVALCLGVLPAVASADLPEGPRLAYVREGLAIPAYEELISSDQTGERWERLAVSTYEAGGFEGLTWSPDGAELAFSGDLFGGIYVLPALGGVSRFVQGTKHGILPAFSTNGRSIAFMRLRFHKSRGGAPDFDTSIWLVDSAGGHARRLTPWRSRFILAPSAFSPDESSLLAEGEGVRTEPEIVSVPLTGGPLSLVIRNGLKASYSPNGSRIAFVRYSHRKVAPGPQGIATGGDLYVAASDGSGVERLTFSPARREESPGWDPSGERLVYTLFPSKRTPEALDGTGSLIMEINPDGTCRQRILFTYGLSYREAAWRPGPGRGLERIQC